MDGTLNNACCPTPRLKWVGQNREKDERTVHNHWSGGRPFRVEGRKLGPMVRAYVCQCCGWKDR